MMASKADNGSKADSMADRSGWGRGRSLLLTLPYARSQGFRLDRF